MSSSTDTPSISSHSDRPTSEPHTRAEEVVILGPVDHVHDNDIVVTTGFSTMLTEPKRFERAESFRTAVTTAEESDLGMQEGVQGTTGSSLEVPDALGRTASRSSTSSKPATSLARTSSEQTPLPATTTTTSTTTDPTKPPLQPRQSVIHHNFPPTSSEDKDSKATTTHSLKTWWKSFSSGGGSSSANVSSSHTGQGKRLVQEHQGQGEKTGGVFAVPLQKSLEYASVQISTARGDGSLYVWGYVPVVVAKCGLHLKATATEVPGTFRVSGSAKRMKELQGVFDSPPKYGKNLDWKKTSYTTHDVATILRRYLTQMPEPIIPYELYHDFRNNLAKTESALSEAIKTYQHLILSMPKPNQYLLLYVLDLLSVFARASDVNLMTAPNLAMIFQPGIISHTVHEMAPAEHTQSQKVLEFLIEHQDHFLLGMQLEPDDPRNTGPDPALQGVDLQRTLTPNKPAELGMEPIVTSPSLSPTSATTSPMSHQLALTASKNESFTTGLERVGTDDVGIAGSGVIVGHAEPVETIVEEPKKVAQPVVPRPPAPIRADTDLMVPSDSDDEAPEGGYYVRSEETRRLQSQQRQLGVGMGLGVARSKTVMDRKSSRTVPVVQEYTNPQFQNVTGSPRSGPGGGGLIKAISTRRGSRSRVVSNDKPPAVIVHDNPPLPGPAPSGLFRRRTAPTKRNRNKEEEEEIRKKAERAVKMLGTEREGAHEA